MTDNLSTDDIIYDCLNIESPKSFFLFAGAGSGKTRSLVNVLEKLKKKNIDFFRKNRKQIAIITYTNAARDEIANRLENDPVFYVSTIHSFVWELIKNYPTDIREWLIKDIETENVEISIQQAKGRATSKAAIDRAKKLETNAARLEKLKEVYKFTYNPNGENRTKESLNHSEVIAIAADFINSKHLLQKILITRFPILLIDESQDTKKNLIDAFFVVQSRHSNEFSLGMFGDTMQRIYGDGKENLGEGLPGDWIKPAKSINHRCPKRVVELINKIRSTVDKQEQIPREDKEEGTVRFYIVSGNVDNKEDIENKLCEKMAEITEDELWKNTKEGVKKLTLEHHMAARRMGFIDLFMPLYRVDKLKTGLLDGSLSGMRFFTHIILPLIKAKMNDDEFEVASVVKKYSTFFASESFKKSPDQLTILKNADNAVSSLFTLWANGNDPNLIQIIRNISASNLFSLPESLSIIARRTETELAVIKDEIPAPENEEETTDNIIDAWDEALNCSFTEIDKYNSYILDKTTFGTHQGVKGLEFPRVMVILDDEEARGFLFSFDKILGIKAPSDTDIKNMKENKDTTIDRTLRLFYVACSRAEKSLAIVAYTSEPEKVKRHIQNIGWFEENEIEIIDSNI